MESQPVSLKGVGDGLRLIIDPALPEERVIPEITPLFTRVRQLATGSRITVDADGRKNELIVRLKEYLIREYGVKEVVRLTTTEPDHQQERKRQREVNRAWDYRKSDVLMMSGRIRSGQKVQARKHLVLMGDVNPGGEVIAGGDIIILGALCGTAWAGQNDNPESIILALDFRPTRIQIADEIAAGQSESCGRATEYARLEENRIVVEEYLAANPFAKRPWPEIR